MGSTRPVPRDAAGAREPGKQKSQLQYLLDVLHSKQTDEAIKCSTHELVSRELSRARAGVLQRTSCFDNFNQSGPMSKLTSLLKQTFVRTEADRRTMDNHLSNRVDQQGSNQPRYRPS